MTLYKNRHCHLFCLSAEYWIKRKLDKLCVFNQTKNRSNKITRLLVSSILAVRLTFTSNKVVWYEYSTRKSFSHVHSQLILFMVDRIADCLLRIGWRESLTGYWRKDYANILHNVWKDFSLYVSFCVYIM